MRWTGSTQGTHMRRCRIGVLFAEQIEVDGGRVEGCQGWGVQGHPHFVVSTVCWRQVVWLKWIGVRRSRAHSQPWVPPGGGSAGVTLGVLWGLSPSRDRAGVQR